MTSAFIPAALPAVADIVSRYDEDSLVQTLRLAVWIHVLLLVVVVSGFTPPLAAIAMFPLLTIFLPQFLLGGWFHRRDCRFYNRDLRSCVSLLVSLRVLSPSARSARSALTPSSP